MRKNINGNRSRIKIIKNPEIKSILIKLTIFIAIFGAIILFIANIFINEINIKIIQQNQGLLGNVLKNHPELENEIIHYVVRSIDRETAEQGKYILDKYGYNLKMEKSLQPILKDINYATNISIISIFLITLVFVFFIIRSEYNKIYSKVQKIHKAASRVIDGDFNIHLKDEGEGEFNILSHKFNQMSNRLENTLSILHNDRVFLKNTISDISHQLKTPLTSLIMLNELMLENKDMNEEVRIKFMEKSKIQLERMEWLIINLLKVARIEAGAIDFKKEKTLLIDAVEAALSTFILPSQGFLIEIEGNRDSEFIGDRDWTVEALINILKNSIEHSKSLKNEDISIKIILGETPIFSRITIIDNGEGIDEKDIPHIFERFYKGKSEIKPESIGIGLNLAKLIIESQNGTISVRSKKGHGTEFTISFLKGII